MKNYNQSPLPFQGQKRRFLKKFIEALKDYPEDAVFVDLFGGSGLLSHTVKQFYPSARVVWNDFDDFQTRLNRIPETNALLSKLRPLLENEPRDKKIRESIRQQMLDIVASEPWVDYVTLSANILFSGKYMMNFEELECQTFYNVIRRSDYNADGYLEGVERIQGDYRNLHQQFKDISGVVFLVDPPYLSTDTKTYGSESYWKLRDYLDVLDVLDGSNYFYFTSSKSQIVELCEWIETRTYTGNPFFGSTMTTTGGSVNYNSSYTDIMLHTKAGFCVIFGLIIFFMKIKVYLVQKTKLGEFYLEVRNNNNNQTIFINVSGPFETKQAAIDYFNENATDDYELIVED